jgi:hypothetical protein
MLKKSASVVLAPLRGSTYRTAYASPLRSLRPCWTAFLSILRAFLCQAETFHHHVFDLVKTVFPQPAKSALICHPDVAAHIYSRPNLDVVHTILTKRLDGFRAFSSTIVKACG